MCQVCGRFGPVQKVLFIQHIGAIVLMFHKRIHGSMCRSCIDRLFWEYTLTTLVLGWWGVISFFLTPCNLIHNVVRYLFTFRSSAATNTSPSNACAAQSLVKSR